MKFLLRYERVALDFINFLKRKGYDAVTIVMAVDFEYTLGYLLEYLDSHGIYCIVDDATIVVMSDGQHHKTTTWVAENNKRYIIYSETLPKAKNIINNYMIAIEEAFKFLEVPF
ncbi:hypothetical protein DSECCO2_120490 [anaerobic digester metagenome]